MQVLSLCAPWLFIFFCSPLTGEKLQDATKAILCKVTRKYFHCLRVRFKVWDDENEVTHTSFQICHVDGRGGNIYFHPFFKSLRSLDTHLNDAVSETLRNVIVYHCWHFERGGFCLPSPPPPHPLRERGCMFKCNLLIHCAFYWMYASPR